jgi:nitrite reductase/ring-hydroxylating ferredoxin subunit
MLGRLLDLLRGKPAIVRGTGKLAEGHAKKVDLGDPLAGGTTVVLCRVGGELHALDARCPHEGGRIADGPLHEGRLALCPLHNYLFDPRTGAVERGACGKATVYRVRERGGDAEVWAR